MSFLQPLLLAALPLISLPIIIHLINQRRYQTMRWAAMMFLLAANRMARGFARLRQWLIMLFRMLVIAGLVFAVSRPLASGWLGMAAGSRADTTIVLLDRSPSMQQRGSGIVTSKLETGRSQLVQTLEKLRSSRYVLIESTRNTPYELAAPDELLRLSNTGPTSASADLPAMLRSAYDYVKANQTGRTDIWICSDLRKNDWNPDSGRWKTLRDSFLELPQSVRFHLLAYADRAPGNLSVRITDARRRPTNDGAELLVSLLLTRETSTEDKISVPVEFEIESARSVVNVELTGPRYELTNYHIGLEGGDSNGWGRVSIPADSNSANDDFYFAFENPPPRRTIIVAEDSRSLRPLQLAAQIAPDPTEHGEAEVVAIDQLATVPWEEISLLLWQESLPSDDEAEIVTSLINRGGQVIFFPPGSPDTTEFLGVRWLAWNKPSDAVLVTTWRGDQDLLAHSQSGAALPVGTLKVRDYCGISGDFTSLAELTGSTPLLARVTTNHGGVYFCTTTVSPQDSSLASDGIVLYVLIQRALRDGTAVLGDTRQLVAGQPSPDLTEPWRLVAATDDAISTDYPFHRGVFAAGEKLLAVNRSADEDQAEILAGDRVADLFQELDFVRVDDRAGSMSSLIQEIWRLFLAAMMVAMLVEAGLCVPKLRQAAGA